VRLKHAGRAKAKVRLTAERPVLLKHVKRVTLPIRAGFTPSGQHKALTDSSPIALRS
jgi:hypothetical protein